MATNIHEQVAEYVSDAESLCRKVLVGYIYQFLLKCRKQYRSDTTATANISFLLGKLKLLLDDCRDSDHGINIDLTGENKKFIVTELVLADKQYVLDTTIDNDLADKAANDMTAIKALFLTYTKHFDQSYEYARLIKHFVDVTNFTTDTKKPYMMYCKSTPTALAVCVNVYYYDAETGRKFKW